MPELNLFLIFIKPLNAMGIPYVVTGSVASILYGEPRMTHDIDLIVEIQDRQIPRFFQAFPEAAFYVPPQDIIRIENSREERGHINLIHHKTGFKADIYFVGQDELCIWAIENALTLQYHNCSLKIAPPEYVILRKLEYYREGQVQKHLIDIRNIMIHSEDKINFQWLSEKIKHLALDNEWQTVKSMQNE
jgi:hypothetical protein